MAFCKKCGAKLDEDANYCRVCGAATDLQVSAPERRREPRPTSPWAYAAIGIAVILVVAVIFAGIAFMAFNAVSFNEYHSVDYHSGVKTLNLNFTADFGRVNVVFENMASSLITLNVSASGRAGVFAPSKPLNVTFQNATEGNTLTVNAKVETADRTWPWSSWLRITCDLHINPSMKANLNVRNSAGEIILDTQAGVTFDSLNLRTGTGAVEANLEDATIEGNVTAETGTGGVEFSWHNVLATGNIAVKIKTGTGGVNVNIKQERALPGNVTLAAQTTTGGVDFNIELGDAAVGAKIEASTTVGGIDVNTRTGFSGTKSLLRSDNYPATSNFDSTLKAVTGGISIQAKYTP